MRRSASTQRTEMLAERRVPTRRQRAPRRLVILSIALLGLTLTFLSFLSFWSRPSLVWNFSPSLAEGLYRFEDRPWRKGDLVAYQSTGDTQQSLELYGALPNDRLLLKRVVAARGDTVCREGARVMVNGVSVAHAKQADLAGAPLPSWRGCHVLASATVFLLGEHSASFDGRYLGPVPASGIVGVISPLVTFPNEGASPQ